MFSSIDMRGISQFMPPHDEQGHHQQEQQDDGGEQQVVIENGIEHRFLLAAGNGYPKHFASILTARQSVRF